MGKKNNNTYDVITNQIIELLKEGIVPWHKPWKGGGSKNLFSNKEYRGINKFILNCKNYKSDYWLTFQQAKKLKGFIKSGEKGTPIIYWNMINLVSKDENVEDKIKPFLRHYTVFNVEQCEGIEIPDSSNEVITFNPISKCEEIISNMVNKPKIEFIHQRAFYKPVSDIINMPKPESFDSAEEYYSTFYHELVHSVGHQSRLNRDTLTDLCSFGSTNYSKEELVAEMGAAFLCGHSGIENNTINNSAAYINGWLKKLKNDNKLIISAASKAQKSTDFVLNTNM